MSGAPLRQLVRHVADGADIGGDVLALVAVAARGGADQPALLVAERAGQAVDLRLGGDVDRPSSAGTRRKRRTRSRNSTTSSSAKALSSDSIGTRWTTLANFAEGAAPTDDSDDGASSAWGSAPRSARFRRRSRRTRRRRRSARLPGSSAGRARRSRPARLCQARGGLLLIEVLDGLLGDTLLGHLLPGTDCQSAERHTIRFRSLPRRAAPRHGREPSAPG